MTFNGSAGLYSVDVHTIQSKNTVLGTSMISYTDISSGRETSGHCLAVGEVSKVTKHTHTFISRDNHMTAKYNASVNYPSLPSEKEARNMYSKKYSQTT